MKFVEMYSPNNIFTIGAHCDGIYHVLCNLKFSIGLAALDHFLIHKLHRYNRFCEMNFVEMYSHNNILTIGAHCSGIYHVL